jgi:hypothetical protein
MARKLSKTAITFEGRAMGKNPFRLFTTSIYSIKWDMNESKRRVSPEKVPSLDQTRTPPNPNALVRCMANVMYDLWPCTTVNACVLLISCTICDPVRQWIWIPWTVMKLLRIGFQMMWSKITSYLFNDLWTIIKSRMEDTCFITHKIIDDHILIDLTNTIHERVLCAVDECTIWILAKLWFSVYFCEFEKLWKFMYRCSFSCWSWTMSSK